MAKNKSTLPTDLVEHYDRLIATQPTLTRKGAKAAYTSLNGHMTSFLTHEYLALRLSKDDREAFVAEHGTDPVIQYGAVMKEYVAVPEKLYANTKEAAKLFASSVAYVGSLKPKATTRRKSGGQRR